MHKVEGVRNLDKCMQFVGHTLLGFFLIFTLGDTYTFNSPDDGAAQEYKIVITPLKSIK